MANSNRECIKSLETGIEFIIEHELGHGATEAHVVSALYNVLYTHQKKLDSIKVIEGEVLAC